MIFNFTSQPTDGTDTNVREKKKKLNRKERMKKSKQARKQKIKLAIAANKASKGQKKDGRSKSKTPRPGPEKKRESPQRDRKRPFGQTEHQSPKGRDASGSKHREKKKYRTDTFETAPAIESDNDDEQLESSESASAAVEQPPPAPFVGPAPRPTTVSAVAKEMKKKAAAAAATTEFGSRKFPKTMKRNEILSSARDTLQHTAKAQNPLRSHQSDHIFSKSAWGELGLDPRLMRYVVGEDGKGMGMKAPTLVQKKTIPIVLKTGSDVVVKSETGSGKTLTYLLPVANVLAGIQPRVQRKDGVLALIMIPTRELGVQVLDVAQRLFRPMPWIIPGMVCGGEKPKAEKGRLRKGVNVLIATPGRLLYHLNSTASMVTSFMRFLVLDEADRMMDLGFEQQMKDVMSCLRSKKANDEKAYGRPPWKTLMLSATQSTNVQSVFGVDLIEPVYVDASTSSSHFNDVYNTPQQLSQHAVLLDSPQKLVGLIGFIRHRFTEAMHKPNNMRKCRILVFFTTCTVVDFHYELLKQCAADNQDGQSTMVQCMKDKIFRLHGNIAQKERSQSIKNFCSSNMGVFLCTDVAARGLDLPNVNWIVQYDAPSETTEYVHRVGRTARKGLAGSALLFLRPCEAAYIQNLEQHGVKLTQIASISVLGGLCSERDGAMGGSRRGEFAKAKANEFQLHLERFVENRNELKTLAAQAFQSWVRSYACHERSTKKIFNIRMLHLGHVAKSFALRDAPSKLGKIGRSSNKAKDKSGRGTHDTKRAGDRFGNQPARHKPHFASNKRPQPSKKSTSR
jgi:ATP-dependent RNA helicase DDX31/DBP7